MAALQHALPPWQILLAIYGLAYLLRHKCIFLMGRARWLDWMLECTFCVGRHAGSLVWLLAVASNGGWPLTTWWGNSCSFVLWVFIGAGWVCIVDPVVRCFDSRSEEGTDGY